MSSIKDRMAFFSGKKKSSEELDKAAAPAEKPDGDILWHGWLGKAGAGILSNTFNKRARSRPWCSNRARARHAS